MAVDSSGKKQIPTAKALDLAGLVDYGEGAIVSRTLLENAAGTITLFSFDAGQGISEHTAPFDAFVQVAEGAGEFTIGGKLVEVRSGQVVVMPANFPHAVKAPQRFKMLLTMLRKPAGK